jgi:hypothetical protein
MTSVYDILPSSGERLAQAERALVDVEPQTLGFGYHIPMQGRSCRGSEQLVSHRGFNSRTRQLIDLGYRVLGFPRLVKLSDDLGSNASHNRLAKAVEGINNNLIDPGDRPQAARLRIATSTGPIDRATKPVRLLRPAENLTAANDDKREMWMELHFVLNHAHQLAPFCSKPCPRRRQRIAHFQLLPKRFYGRAHPYQRDARVPVFGKEPSLDELAPRRNLIACTTLSHDGVVLLPRTLIAIDPAPSRASPQAEQTINLRQAVGRPI